MVYQCFNHEIQKFTALNVVISYNYLKVTPFKFICIKKITGNSNVV